MVGYPSVSFFYINQYPASCEGGPLLSEKFLRSNFFSGALSTFIHLSLCKAGPFDLENHIHVKACKTQGFPNNWMLYETFIQKTAPKQFFKGVPLE